MGMLVPDKATNVTSSEEAVEPMAAPAEPDGDAVGPEDEAWSGVPAAPTDWTCTRCGAENKAAWRMCTSCEATRDGTLRTPPKQRRPGPGLGNIVLGVIVIAAMITLLVVFSEEIVDWVRSVAESVAGWFDRQFSQPDEL